MTVPALSRDADRRRLQRRFCSRSRPRVRRARRLMLHGGEMLAAEHRPLRHGHAEALLPMVDRVAAAAGQSNRRELTLSPPRPGRAALPGFVPGWPRRTGSRWQPGRGCVGVTSFAAVAAGLAARRLGCRSRDCDEGGCARLLVALDSRRDDFYVQLFADGSRDAAGRAACGAAEPARLLCRRADRRRSLLIAGDRAEPPPIALGRDRPVSLIAGARRPSALGVAAAALSACCARGAGVRAGAAVLSASPGRDAAETGPVRCRPPGHEPSARAAARRGWRSRCR